MKTRIILILSLLTFLQACATGYQSGEWSYTGGFYESEAPGKLIKITFAGNGYIDSDTAEAYTLYRCAEYTKEQGGSHFVVYKSLFDAAQDKRSLNIALGSIGGKPSNFAYILLRNEPEEGALEASKIMEKYQKVVHPVKVKRKQG